MYVWPKSSQSVLKQSMLNKIKTNTCILCPVASMFTVNTRDNNKFCLQKCHKRGDPWVVSNRGKGTRALYLPCQPGSWKGAASSEEVTWGEATLCRWNQCLAWDSVVSYRDEHLRAEGESRAAQHLLRKIPSSVVWHLRVLLDNQVAMISSQLGLKLGDQVKGLG